MFKRDKIIVLGSINTDISVKGKRLPKPGETIYANEISYSGGGKGANQAIAASRLLSKNSKIEMIGAVGDDLFSLKNLETLKKEGILTKGIRSISGTSTGTAVIFLDEINENYILLLEGANYKCSNKELSYLEETLTKNSILLLQHEIPINTVHEAMKISNKKGALTILDPAPYMDIKIKNYYKNVDILTPNQIEAENLSKITIDSLENAFLAGEKILSLGPNFVVITLGEQGCVLISNQDKIHLEGYKVNIANSVGAGDCFNGALAAGIKKGLSLKESIKLGNKSASISVSRKGVQESMPFFNEINTIEL